MVNLNTLLDILFSPTGLLVSFGLIVVIRLVFRNDLYVWYLLAAMALFASFAEFKDPFGRATPPLVEPLQQLRQFGRVITIGALALLSIYMMSKKTLRQNKKVYDVFSIKNALLVIQFLIFLKNLIYGNIITAFLTFSVFLLVYLIFYNGVSYWLHSESYFKRSVFSFLIAIVIFNAMVIYQSLINPSAMYYFNGRFIGMTGNPQHAAVLLTSGVPLFLVFIIDYKKLWQKLILLFGILLTIYFLVQTGSRTGMVMGFVVVIIFLSGYRGAAVKWLILGTIVASVFVTLTEFNPTGDVDREVLERLGSTENTRAEVVEIQLRQFTQNIVFGAEPRGDRVGFAENSYLAVAASLGILGLIPLFVMLRGLFKMIYKLWKTARYSKNKHFYYLVISGLVSLLAGAFVEAYLLGNITWPIILLLCYVHWGYYLLQKDNLKSLGSKIV